MPDLFIVQLIAVPIISAITGYLTNTVAVRMLFRPREARRVFGVPVQGLIPKRRHQVAEKIGETVEKHLISHDDIKLVMADPQVTARIEAILDERVDDALRRKVSDLHPMVGAFMNEKLIVRIKTLIMNETMDAVGPVTEHMMDALEENLDFKELVTAKIREFDLERFEEIVLEIARRELRAIEILGGVMGLVIGLLTDLLLLWGRTKS